MEQAFLFHGRSSDFQDVTAQGVVTFRVVDADQLASRLDFSIDLRTGRYQKKPLEQLAAMFTQRAQELAWGYLSHNDVRSILAQGVEQVKSCIATGLAQDTSLAEMGLSVVSVRVAGIAPTSELEKALQAPTRERIQQNADEATFQRRAMAVEKERAIQENELANKIEISRREEQLIAQEGQNERRRILEGVETNRIATESKVTVARMESVGEAENLRRIEEARIEGERARMLIYKDMPTAVMYAVALQKFAGKISKIDHLNVSPDMLGPLLGRVLEAGAERLERSAAGGKTA
jgi:regulator of protease activity HflC (stomatin/prohibitin superfamily)